MSGIGFVTARLVRPWGWFVEVHSLFLGVLLALEPGAPERVVAGFVALDDWGNEPGDEGLVYHDVHLVLWMRHFI